jgi:hypothetical protein
MKKESVDIIALGLLKAWATIETDDGIELCGLRHAKMAPKGEFYGHRCALDKAYLDLNFRQANRKLPYSALEADALVAKFHR